MKKVCIINGSRVGNDGNTAKFLRALVKIFMENHGVEARIMALTEYSSQEVLEELEDCEGVIVATGTIWSFPSSRFVGFLEDITYTECSNLWTGKPIGIIATAHSMGVSGVIQGILQAFNNFSCLIPPCCTIGLTLVGQEALAHSENPHLGDVNCPADMIIIAQNIYTAMCTKNSFTTWSVHGGDPGSIWVDQRSIDEE